MVNHEQSRVLHEALSAVGAQSICVLIAGAGHEGPEFVAPAITATVAGFLAENRLGRRFDIDRRARVAVIRPNPLVHVARPRFGGCRACALAPATVC